jgi:hypothetical protein
MEVLLRPAWTLLMPLPIPWRASIVLFAFAAGGVWVLRHPRRAARAVLGGACEVVEMAAALVLVPEYAVNDRRLRAGRPPLPGSRHVGDGTRVLARALHRLRGHVRREEVATTPARPASRAPYVLALGVALLPFWVWGLRDDADPKVADAATEAITWWANLDDRVMGR